MLLVRKNKCWKTPQVAVIIVIFHPPMVEMRTKPPNPQRA